MQQVLFILTPLFPALCAAALLLAPKTWALKRINAFVLAALGAGFALTAAASLMGDGAVTLFSLTNALPIVLRSDGVSRLFALLVSAMCLISAACGVPYMNRGEGQKGYYTFYLFTLSAMLGVCFSGTLVTMYLCFEMTTLLSVALVVHNRTKEAVAAGVKYLLYSIAGAMMGLFGIFLFTAFSPAPVFAPGGTLDAERIAGHEGLLLWALLITIVGFATKAGMFPMHGWLPTAHPEAPAPASAILSGVITKMGVLCVIRVLYYTVGADFARGTWVQTTLLILALATVFMGSMMAFKTTLFKKRLAYSTVSQVSYILFGLFLLDKTAMEGALMHVVFHSVMKNALFLCAGAIIMQTGKTDVRELRGVGKRMPATVWCFTLAGVGLVGVPPFSGFISKWQLAQGALGSAVPVFSWLGPVVLLISALLTAAYLLPISIHAFFPGRGEGAEAASLSGDAEVKEVGWQMLAPLVLLTVLNLLFGLCPSLVGGLASAIAAGVL